MHAGHWLPAAPPLSGDPRGGASLHPQYLGLQLGRRHSARETGGKLCGPRPAPSPDSRNEAPNPS